MSSDKDAFREAMSGVTPLTPPNQAEVGRAKAPAIPRQTIKDERRVLSELDRPFEDPSVIESLETGEELLFSRTGLSPKVFRRLRRGHYSVSSALDLHHMDVETAASCLGKFIERAHERGHGCVRIVHGKGLRSRGRPKLKLLTNRFLRRNKSVLAFASCRPVDGGTGAVYVLLKSRKTTPA